MNYTYTSPAQVAAPIRIEQEPPAMYEMEIKRGDIVYVERQDATGFENEGGRPAIVVSNGAANACSSVIEVVFLTTKSRKALPTHTQVLSDRVSTALCEQITSVSKLRVTRICGHVTDEEMDRVDRCLLISLGLSQKFPEHPQNTEQNTITPDIAAIIAERDAYKNLLLQALGAKL